MGCAIKSTFDDRRRKQYLHHSSIMIPGKDDSRYCVTSISVRTEILRDEITLIQHQEEFYRRAARHSLVDKTARASRKFRLWEIRTELGKLREHLPA